MPLLVAIIGVGLISYGVRLIVDPAYRERVDVSRPGYITHPLDQLWFRGPRDKPLRDDLWKRLGWVVTIMGAFNLVAAIIYMIVE